MHAFRFGSLVFETKMAPVRFLRFDQLHGIGVLGDDPEAWHWILGSSQPYRSLEFTTKRGFHQKEETHPSHADRV